MAVSAIGYKIREQRRRLGITQAAMARKLGISASYLNLIEANKRAVGGQLLSRLAAELTLSVDALTGEAERRLSHDLGELPTDPLLRGIDPDPRVADELVARYPDWARAVLTLYRAYLENNQAVTMLSDRLNRDPLLQESVHRMLTHITSIRSSAEILQEVEDLEPDERRRFQNTIHSESAALSDAAQRLVGHFELAETRNPSIAAAEEVDDFIIGHRNFFPELEQAAGELRRELDALGRRNLDGALVEFLQARFRIRVEHATPDETAASGFKNQCRFENGERRLMMLGHAPNTTRRFQMMRTAAEHCFGDLLAASCDDHRLSSTASRGRAAHALAAYIAGAALLPYDEFLDDAESHRYDVEILRQRYDASFEQIAHRLITLRQPGSEGVPFAFLRVDPSGHISKRFPLHALPLPRYGHVCPLWSVFSAFQTPFRVIRQLSEFPGGRRFLMISRTVTKRSGAFHAQSVMFAIMLACDTLHADRTVYSEGLDFDAPGTAVAVGPTCRLCDRQGCQQRQQPAITATAA